VAGLTLRVALVVSVARSVLCLRLKMTRIMPSHSVKFTGGGGLRSSIRTTRESTFGGGRKLFRFTYVAGGQGGRAVRKAGGACFAAGSRTPLHPSSDEPAHRVAWATATARDFGRQPRKSVRAGARAKAREGRTTHGPAHNNLTTNRGAHLEELVNLGQELRVHGQPTPHVRVGPSSATIQEGGEGAGGGVEDSREGMKPLPRREESRVARALGASTARQ